jgi:hypothetical protein
MFHTGGKAACPSLAQLDAGSAILRQDQAAYIGTLEGQRPGAEASSGEAAPRRSRAWIEPFQALAAVFRGDRNPRPLSCPRKRASRSAGAQTTRSSCPVTLDPRFRGDDRSRPSHFRVRIEPFQALAAAFPGDRSAARRAGSGPAPGGRERRRRRPRSLRHSRKLSSLQAAGGPASPRSPGPSTGTGRRRAERAGWGAESRTASMQSSL